MKEKASEPAGQQGQAMHVSDEGSGDTEIRLPNTQSQYMDVRSLSFILILIALSLSLFCVGLDNIIIATAIPAITDEFHAINHIGW